MWLFHGTKANRFVDVCESGLVGDHNTRTNYGAGLYTTMFSAYAMMAHISVAHAPPSQADPYLEPGDKVIFVCRGLCGVTQVSRSDRKGAVYRTSTDCNFDSYSDPLHAFRIFTEHHKFYPDFALVMSKTGA